jgi:hypothetical protein
VSDTEILQYLVTILRDAVGRQTPMSPGRIQGILNNIEANRKDHERRERADNHEV